MSEHPWRIENVSDNLVPEVFQHIKMADFEPTFPLADHPLPTHTGDLME